MLYWYVDDHYLTVGVIRNVPVLILWSLNIAVIVDRSSLKGPEYVGKNSKDY